MDTGEDSGKGGNRVAPSFVVVLDCGPVRAGETDEPGMLTGQDTACRVKKVYYYDNCYDRVSRVGRSATERSGADT